MRISDWSSDVCSSDLPQRLRLEGARALLGREREPIGRGLPRRVHVAREFDVAAERHPAELPARAALVGTAPDLPAEADRKGVGLDPEPAAGEIMPQLVDEHRSEEHTSELQSLMRISYAVFCLKKK